MFAPLTVEGREREREREINRLKNVRGTVAKFSEGPNGIRQGKGESEGGGGGDSWTHSSPLLDPITKRL